MAKKKALAIEDALSSPAAPQKWQQQFSDRGPGSEPVKAPEKAERLKRKTYLMTDELIRRAETQAAAYQVGVNEMVRYCLDYALSLIEAGEHKPEAKEVTVKKVTLNV